LFRVTSLNERGDTVFSRRYPQPAQRIAREAIDNFLGSIQSCGANSAAQIRELAEKQIPVFRSFLTGVVPGRDGSTAVLLRTANDTSRTREALVIDPRGAVVGTVRFTFDQSVAAVSRDHIWMVEIGKDRARAAIVRYRLDATAAPPARSAAASASSRPSRPPA
jgi:hypothetical protein